MSEHTYVNNVVDAYAEPRGLEIEEKDHRMVNMTWLGVKYDRVK